ncbi:MAG: alpha/beta hydrolase [Pseudomonadota bacterium]
MSALPILTYERAGNGPPVVLVHGYLGASAHWSEQMERLSDTFEIIAIDLPGFGESAHLTAPNTIAGFAEHVLDTLSQMGVSEFNLLGHSMGGMIVQQMALMAPGRITKLICYGTGPVGLLPGRFEPIQRSRERLATEGVEATARRIAATWFADYEDGPGFDLCARVGARASLQAGLACLDAWESWNVEDRLSEITCPTLIVWGEMDRSYDRNQPQALKAGIPGAQLVTVPGCAHNVHMEAPDQFAGLVSDFLKV